MMKVLLAMVLPVVASGGFQVASADELWPVETGYRAISLCLEAYADATGTQIRNDIDRAYVYTRPDVAAVLFARGAMGSFLEHDPNFVPILNCDVAVQVDEVQRLFEYQKTWVDKVPKDYEEFYHPDEDFIESWYVREGDHFTHVASQANSLCWRKKLGSDVPPPGYHGMKVTPCPD